MKSANLSGPRSLGLMAILVAGVAANAQPVKLKLLYMGSDPPLDMQINRINDTQALGGIQLQFIQGRG